MGAWFRFLGWLAVLLGIPAVLLYGLFVDVWRVPTDDPLLAASIEPTLSAGDWVLVTRRTSVGRGNLLRCADPQAIGRFVVARAIARAGESVEINQEVVAVDGKRPSSPRACDPQTITLHDPQNNEDVLLACSEEEFGEGSYQTLRVLSHAERTSKDQVVGGRWFLVSDDRHLHLDSRDFGQIDPATCQHIVFRLAGAAGFSDQRRRLQIIW